MDWTHIAVIVIALAIGVFIGAKNPAILSKVTGGQIAALSGVLAPTRGEVWLDGQRLSELERRARARRIALLPQHTDIAWPITARSLVELGRIPVHVVVLEAT